MTAAAGAGTFPLAPGATIGILGGGQLGRMTALAAASLGYKCHVYAPERDSPAGQVSAASTVAPYDDRAALRRFAAAVGVVTYEFENVPFDTVESLARWVPVRPRPECLRTAQDRLLEKEFVNGLGGATAPYVRVSSLAELAAGIEGIGRPAVLKTARMGYDGKGQVVIEAGSDLAQAWSGVAGHFLPPSQPMAILEAFIPFEKELSVIVARGESGELAVYPPVENRHVRHVLDSTRAPAEIPGWLALEAVDVARRIAEALALVGLVAVEMFVARVDGGRPRVLVNEIAPRPHNSGHWTIDACRTSQFEQLVRAIVGLPLGPVERHADATMKNLIGDEAAGWRALAAEPNAKLHLYGKSEPRPGRKMGHVTRLYPVGGLPPEPR